MVQDTAVWNLARGAGKVGTGDWEGFDGNLDRIWRAAEHWSAEVKGADRLWLCWSLNDRWCKLQQRLVLEAGYTPVVGWDPAHGARRPSILPGAVAIDFNRGLGYPVLWPHVPLEFAFLWADKLAFWHSDLLIRIDKMNKLVALFDGLRQGQMAAVKSTGGLRHWFNFKQHRYWELVGCTTRLASRRQFDAGCGWWRPFRLHPNTPREQYEFRNQHYWDHGAGVMYWKRHCGGEVIDIRERYVSEGHFSITADRKYLKAASKAEEMDLNYDLRDCANRLGLGAYLGE